MFRLKKNLTVAILAFATLAIRALGADGLLLPEPPDQSQALPEFFQALEKKQNQVREHSDSGEPWIDLGRLYHANSFFEQATMAYRNGDATAGQNREKAQIAYYLADIALARGNIAKGTDHLSKSLSLEPDYAPAWLRSGSLALKTGETSLAIESFENCLRIDDDNRFAKLGLARIDVQQGQINTALPQLEQIVEEHPDLVAARALLAQLYERKGQVEEARELREQNRSVWDANPADPWLDAVQQLCFDPNRLSIDFEDLVRVENYEAAFEVLDRLAAISGQEAQAELLRGRVFVKTNQYQKAAIAFENSIQESNAPATAYTSLIKALVYLGKNVEAKSVSDKALSRYPENLDILVESAGVQLDLGQVAPSVILLQKALSIDPYDLMANKLLSTIYRRTGQPEKALEYLERLRRVSPRDLYPRVAIGTHYLDARQPDKAIPPLEEAFSIEANDDTRELLAAAHAIQGDMLQQDGNIDSAIAKYETALEIWPSSQEALVSKLNLVYSLKKYNEAESVLKDLIEINGKQIRLLLALGDVQLKIGKTKEARATLERASKLPEARGNSSLLREIEARIRSIE